MGAEKTYAGQDVTGMDFTGQDLRRADFTEAHADGVVFREADIRGVSFARADLRGADFTDAKLGLGPVASGVLFLLGVAVAALAGIAIGFVAGDAREVVTTPGWENTTRSGAFIFLTALFIGTLWMKGAKWAVVVFAGALVVMVALGGAVFSAFSEYDPGIALRLGSLSVLLVAVILAAVLGRIIGGTFGAAAIMAVAVVGGIVAGGAGGGIGAIIISIITVVLAKRALKKDSGDRPLRKLVHKIVSARGTRFTGADVRDADFSGTRIVHCDAKDALTEGVIWERGKGPLPYLEGSES